MDSVVLVRGPLYGTITGHKQIDYSILQQARTCVSV